MSRPTASLLLLVLASAAQAGHLNDTGVTQCLNVAGTAYEPCTPTNDGDTAPSPRQDGRFGRDAAAGAGVLPKTGGGAAGFDFTKMCWNGDAEGSGTCTGALVANTTGTPSATPSTDWACTKDNVTNLIWSLESGSGNWAYATTTYPVAMNATGRCGFSTGWRLPTRRELLSIVHLGANNPSIDANYFPRTKMNWYLSSDIYAPNPAYAWFVVFNFGSSSYASQSYDFYVRLVRSGQ